MFKCKSERRANRRQFNTLKFYLARLTPNCSKTISRQKKNRIFSKRKTLVWLIHFTGFFL
ncbi:hypothetical protein QR98_0043970 [Sarcoptes scabiei]|uniref:Uncharacterized protein n=1 Tax=Sarcoptes scabiei TaxID=52283 RepID=A0A132A5M9_SARSC|nr:hypothetical protein QR98_0043970 [Sarcoptes scabiei]